MTKNSRLRRDTWAWGKRTGRISREDEVAIARGADTTPADRSRLVGSVACMAVTLADKRFMTGSSADYDDLLQDLLAAASVAVDRFDTGRGHMRYSTFSWLAMCATVRTYLANSVLAGCDVHTSNERAIAYYFKLCARVDSLMSSGSSRDEAVASAAAELHVAADVAAGLVDHRDYHGARVMSSRYFDTMFNSSRDSDDYGCGEYGCKKAAPALSVPNHPLHEAETAEIRAIVSAAIESAGLTRDERIHIARISDDPFVDIFSKRGPKRRARATMIRKMRKSLALAGLRKEDI